MNVPSTMQDQKRNAIDVYSDPSFVVSEITFNASARSLKHLIRYGELFNPTLQVIYDHVVSDALGCRLYFFFSKPPRCYTKLFLKTFVKVRQTAEANTVCYLTYIVAVLCQ